MRGDPKNPTISLIAQEAGVSRATVSLALRENPRISDATRDRIKAIARQLGWQPNPLLAQAMSALRAGQPTVEQVTMAWITMFPERSGWQHQPFYERTHEGAVERARLSGYHLEHFWIGDARGRLERLGDILYTRGIAGAIFAPLPQPGTVKFAWERFACATIGFSVENPRLHRAIDNHNAAIRAAVTRLQAAGCQRIGLIIQTNFDRRIHGLHSAGYFWQIDQNQDFHPELLFRPTELTGQEFDRWRREARPDAIISGHPEVLDWLRSSQIKMPEELSFVSLDLPTTDGSVTGIHQDPEAVGASAVDTVAGQLLRNERGLPDKPRTLLVDGHWVEGATTPAAAPDSPAVQRAASLLCNRQGGESAQPASNGR